MRVLIVSESAGERAAMARHLVDRAHTVETVGSTAEALKHLDGEGPEIVVLDWATTSKPSTVDVLHRLRSEEGAKHTYSIVVMSNPVAASVSAAFGAGADDLLRRPFLREELVARVGAIERIRRWASKLLGQTEDLTTKLARLRCEKVGERAIRDDLGALFQQPFEVRPGSSLRGRAVVAVEIPLTMVNEALECCLQIGVDPESLNEAARMLLGEDAGSDDAVADMFRELANVAGGAFVGAAENDGISVTLGLPTNAKPNFEWDKTPGNAQELTLGVPGTSVELSIRILMTSRELRRMRAREVRAGMVLARDVLNREGGVLLPAATHLTASSVDRLLNVVGSDSLVTVLAQ